jgi:threonine synthase
MDTVGCASTGNVANAVAAGAAASGLDAVILVAPGATSAVHGRRRPDASCLSCAKSRSRSW